MKNQPTKNVPTNQVDILCENQPHFQVWREFIHMKIIRDSTSECNIHGGLISTNSGTNSKQQS